MISMEMALRKLQLENKLEKVNAAYNAMNDVKVDRNALGEEVGKSRLEPDAMLAQTILRRIRKDLRTEIRDLGKSLEEQLHRRDQSEEGA